MNTLETNTKQCIYKLGLLELEFQFILSKHPADITVDEYEWMQIAFEQVPKCLKTLITESDYDTYLILWFHQAQKIEKFCGIRKLPILEKFIGFKLELEILNNQLMAKKNN